MIDKPMRNHYLYIIKEILTFIKASWFLVILFITKGLNVKTVLWVLLGIVLGVFFVILDWRKFRFYVKDGMLVLERGVISKSKQDIPFDKINTIDSTQSILDRIFKVYTLKIDTGSVIAEKSEFKVIVKYEVLENLRNTILGEDKVKKEYIQNSKSNEIEKEYVHKDLYIEDKKEEGQVSYNDLKNSNEKDKIFKNSTFNKDRDLVNKRVITAKEIFKYALTKSKIFWAIGLFFAANNFLDDIFKNTNFKFAQIIKKYLDLNAIQSKSVLVIILGFIAFIVFLYMIIVLISIVFEMVRLNNFTVKTYKDKISISYGFFTKKQYSFKLDKIYGIRYKQSLLQQFMKIGELELITVGYGDEKDEKAILYPIVNENLKDSFIKDILKDLVFKGERKTPPKSSKVRFILKPCIIWSVILLPTYILLKIVPSNIKLSVIIIIFIFSFVSSFLDFKNTSLGMSENSLIASNGGLKKITTTIREDDIQSITKKQTIFQKKSGICTYNIDLYSNKLGDVIKVKYMEEILYEKMQENIKF
ncbi:PH domain-containing protein [Clostridium oceanicum]|uniref:YdbS-like PH domain-containing protein n=1 Tax=Clostridium oceanicum TaxID=1543 RepID=A0ABN1JD87_9CLOT